MFAVLAFFIAKKEPELIRLSLFEFHFWLDKNRN